MVGRTRRFADVVQSESVDESRLPCIIMVSTNLEPVLVGDHSPRRRNVSGPARVRTTETHSRRIHDLNASRLTCTTCGGLRYQTRLKTILIAVVGA